MMVLQVMELLADKLTELTGRVQMQLFSLLEHALASSEYSCLHNTGPLVH